MTEVRRIDPETGFIREFKEIAARVGSLETKPAGSIVIRETLTTEDPETGVKTTIGQLPDGSYGFQPFIGDIVPPPVATQPVVSAQPGIFTVSWDGLFVANEEKPHDFQHVNVIGHLMDGTTTLSSLTVGVLRLATDTVFVAQDIAGIGDSWQFSLESEDYNGNLADRGIRSPTVVMQSTATDAGVTEALAALQADADAAAASALTAQGAADSAQTDADAAAASALAASNLAATKGKILYQTTAPTGADANALTLWIDTAGGANTPKRWVSGTTWAAVTDKVATDAAALAATKTKTYFQTAQPSNTGNTTGDLWFDTDDNNKTYVWNGTAWTVAQDATINKSIFGTFSTDIDQTQPNKWLYTRYDKTGLVNTVAPSYLDIVGLAGTSSLIADGAQLVVNVGEQYIGQLRTIVNIATSKTIAVTATHDDGAQIYVDGVSVYTKNTYTAGAAISFAISAGWHVIDMLWLEQAGGDGWSNVSPTFGSQFTSMFAPVSLTATSQAVSAAQTSASAAQTSANTAMSSQSYSTNASFDDWAGTLPAGFATWSANPVKETTLFRRAPFAARFNVPDATAQYGLQFTSPLAHAPNLEYFTVEMEFYLVSGGLGQAGMILDWNGLTNGRAQINLFDEVPSPATGKWYRVVKTLRRPTNATGTWSSMGGYLMAQWTGHTGGGAAKNIIYDWFNIRPASTEEITAYNAPVDAQTKATLAQVTAITTAQQTTMLATAYLKNPSFDDWAGTLPDTYTTFGAIAPTKDTTNKRVGAHGMKFTVSGTEDAGIEFTAPLAHMPNLEYVTVEMEFMLLSGTLTGAGLLIDWTGINQPNRALIPLSGFATSPSVNKWYRVSAVVRRPSSTGTWTNTKGWLMANWNELGTKAAKTVVYDWLNVRPSTTEEITAYGAPAKYTELETATAAKGKVLIQSTTPAVGDQLAQNLWIDTTGGANTPKRWNGSDWIVVTDKVAVDAASAAAAAQTKADQAFNNAATAATAAGNAQTTADGKNRVWYQDAAPAGIDHKTNDVWFDTNDGNKPYRWTDADTWVVAQDAAIAAAQATADAAYSTSNGKNTTYYQPGQPSGGTYILGDLWFDTDAAYKLYTYNGSIWQATQDAAAAQAAAIAAAATDATTKATNAQTAAIAAAATDATTKVATKNKTYFQPASPALTGNTTGDVWFDTDDGNKPYVWNGTAWTDARDATIAAAQSTANTAVTSANGKNKVIYSTSAASGTTGYVAGDTWFQRDGSNNIIGQWEFTTSWQSRALDNAVIANLNAAKLTAGTIAADRFAANSITTGKLIVGDMTNFVVDPYMTGTGAINSATYVTATSTSVSAGAPYERLAYLNARDNLEQPDQGRPATGGDQFYVEAWVRATNAATQSILLGLWTKNQSGTNYWTTGPAVTVAAGQAGWVKTTATLTAPANIGGFPVVNARAWLQINGSIPADITGWYVTGWTMRRKNTGSLIVDGAITANSLIIATGAIGNAQIADLNADKITAGLIAAARLDAETIKAKLIAATDIVATDIFAQNSITSASGIFGTMNASVINAGTIAADRLDAETVKAKLIDASLINAVDILASDSITATNGIIGSLDVSKVTAGTMSGSYITAKTMTVDKLVITSTDNLIVEANFGNNGSSWGLGANNTINATAGRGSLPAMRFTGTVSSVYTANLVNRVSVGAEDRFRGSLWVKSTAAIAAGNIQLRLRCYTTATAYTDITAASNAALVADTWTNVSGISPILPANTVAIEFLIAVTNNATGTITDIDYVAVTRAADGKLVVDGAIDGKTITGATIQTAATGARVLLDTTGIYGYDATGTNYLSGTSAGLTLTGMLKNKGVSDDDVTPVPMTVYVGNLDMPDTSWDPIGIHFAIDSKTLGTYSYVPPRVFSPNGTELQLQSGIDYNGDPTTPAPYSSINLQPGHAQLHGSDNAFITAGNFIQLQTNAAEGNLNLFAPNLYLGKADGTSDLFVSGASIDVQTYGTGGVTIESGGTINLDGSSDGVFMDGAVYIQNRKIVPVRFYQSTLITSYPPHASLWGPGQFVMNANASYDGDFVSIPGNDLIDINETGVYQFEFIFWPKFLGVNHYVRALFQKDIGGGNWETLIAGHRENDSWVWEWGIYRTTHVVGGSRFRINFVHDSGATREWVTQMMVTKIR